MNKKVVIIILLKIIFLIISELYFIFWVMVFGGVVNLSRDLKLLNKNYRMFGLE